MWCFFPLSLLSLKTKKYTKTWLYFRYEINVTYFPLDKPWWRNAAILTKTFCTSILFYFLAAKFSSGISLFCSLIEKAPMTNWTRCKEFMTVSLHFLFIINHLWFGIVCRNGKSDFFLFFVDHWVVLGI